MAAETNIEWCDATFNPWIGCTRVSPGCDHCYAARSTPARTMGIEWGAHAERHRTSADNWAAPKRWNDAHEAFFAQHGRRRRVFCASLADVFDNQVNPAWREDLWKLIEATPNLDWLLLTKRIGVVAPWAALWGWPANAWLGISVVNQTEAERDIPKQLEIPAPVRFLSMEPLLGPVDLAGIECDGDSYLDPLTAWSAKEMTEMWGEPRDAHPRVDWVIVGGESGSEARPMHPDWVRALRDQCAEAGVPFLFKQWGEWIPRGPESMGYPLVEGVPRIRLTDLGENGSDLGAAGDNHVWMQRAGKKAAGRLLDGVEHNGFPKGAAA